MSERGATSIPELIIEKDRLKKAENIKAFFNELKAKKKINSVYYPGPGFDNSLNDVFDEDKLVYIDKTPYFEGVRQGDFRKTDIPSDSIDALFVQDIHHSKLVFPELLRVVKDGGLVVVSLYGCGIEPRDAMTLKDYDNIQQLTKIHPTPDWEHLFQTYERRIA